MNNGLAVQTTWDHSEDYLARLLGISFSPSFADDRTLFTSQRGYILRTEDAGAHWTAATPDGLLAEEEEPADYTLWAFSPDYEHDETVLLGTNRRQGVPLDRRWIGLREGRAAGRADLGHRGVALVRI